MEMTNAPERKRPFGSHLLRGMDREVLELLSIVSGERWLRSLTCDLHAGEDLLDY